MSCELKVGGVASTSELGWLNGWKRSHNGFELEAFVRRDGQWEKRRVPADWLYNSRSCEPSNLGPLRSATSNLRLRIPDLSTLHPLLNPGSVARAVVPAARNTRHAMYVFECEEGNVYVPASLLIRELWLWADSTLDALLTPGSIGLHLEPLRDDEGPFLQVRGPLARAKQSDTALRRLSWLAQSEDARLSWSSVLTFAHSGTLRLNLPKASFDAWAWGIEVPSGLLVVELSSVNLQFHLQQANCRILMGHATRRCPSEAVRRTGQVSF